MRAEFVALVVIGGPHDGERPRVRGGVDWIRLAVLPKLGASVADWSPYAASTVETAEYCREVLTTSSGRRLEFWRHSELSLDEAIERLSGGYRG